MFFAIYPHKRPAEVDSTWQVGKMKVVAGYVISIIHCRYLNFIAIRAKKELILET